MPLRPAFVLALCYVCILFGNAVVGAQDAGNKRGEVAGLLKAQRTQGESARPLGCSVSFSDVPSCDGFYPFVACLVCKGVLSGYGDGTFRPGANVTRDQLAKIVANAAGFAEAPTGETFQDAPTSSPFYLYIERLTLRGVISGYPCGGTGEPCVEGNRPYFRPNNPASRGQIAKIVSEAAGFHDIPSGYTFTDVPENNPFYIWIERLSSRGVIGGYACGRPTEPCDQQNRPYFRYGNNATRAQIAKIVSSAFFPDCANVQPVPTCTSTPTPPPASPTPGITTYQIGNLRDLDVSPPSDVDAHFEIPFWIVPGGTRQINISTHQSYSCWIPEPGNPLTDHIVIDKDRCSSVSIPPVWKGNSNAPAWARNYDGLFTQHVINTEGTERLVAFHAGENKNELRPNVDGEGISCYQNGVNSDIQCESCASGYNANGEYTDCWEAYNSFVNVSWQVYDAEHSWGIMPRNDVGPAIWPVNGYTVGGSKSSHGVRHPHGFVDGKGYVWVFYRDNSFGAANGGGGIKVARAQTSSGGLPGSWQTYCNGAWVNSLPAGFDKNNIGQFFAQRGGCASSVLPTEHEQVSFAVAQVGSGGYVGIEERLVGWPPSTWELRLWHSTDLINWTNPQTLLTRSSADAWAAGELHYPVFLSANGWRSDLLEGDTFYVLGTRNGTLRVLPLQARSSP